MLYLLISEAESPNAWVSLVTYTEFAIEFV